jgi:hypothetical protein
MSNPISYNPFLGWVDATDPDNLPVDVRIIGASDLLRYENFGVAATTKINAESVRVDGALTRLTSAEGAITGLNTSVGGLNTSVGGLGTRITALEAVPPATTVIRKPSDAIKASSTALTNDAALVLTLGPSEDVEIEAVLFVTSPAAAGFKVALTGVGLASGRWGIGNTFVSASGATLTVATTGSAQIIMLKGYIRGGASGGAVALQWAQDTSNAGTTTLHSFSYLKLFHVSGG